MKGNLWTLPLRSVLGLMWLAHGLEKFGVNWPIWLAGGTHSVPDMLGLMAESTSIRALASLIETVFLPAGGWLQVPVGLTEVALGILLLAGVGLRVAAWVGFGLQAFIWLGFLSLEWPMQYPLVMAAHVAIGLSSTRPRMAAGAIGAAAATLWVYAIVTWPAPWGSWPWTRYVAGALHLALALLTPQMLRRTSATSGKGRPA